MSKSIDAANLRTLFDMSRDALAALDDPVAARFAAAIPADPGEALHRAPAWTPGTDALANARPGARYEDLVATLQGLAPQLEWRQSYKRSPQMESYLKGYGYIEFLGQRGHYAPAGAAFGIGVIGPDCLYPTHRHGPEEIYLPIAGSAEWSYDHGPWIRHGAGSVVHTRPWQWHALRTGTETVVLLYAWLGGDPVNVSEFAPVA
ncbi:cupin domain-containing protein [Limibaculum sp. M0105]|uniref:Cupin domain-containing protein n=1 Tax=Thermohalobaculum xanthum TaxID=2753746 RepID=A0A8J7M3K9_9RHOB|nr:dimethylsulfonioproprionate lyase family protein [Thermohalobaculum xanthum]MBK0397661.1 cupin domain-containing protein [Thermohalobaculum xanthum]